MKLIGESFNAQGEELVFDLCIQEVGHILITCLVYKYIVVCAC